MSTDPIVTIIIPAYNDESFVAQSIESALGQSLKELEVICIDDGSEDDTITIFERYKNADARVSVHKQENRGAGPARNLGLTHAKGRFISFLDADDYFPSEDVLSALVTSADAYNVDIAGGVLIKDENGTITCNDDTQYIRKPQIMRYDDYQFDFEFYKYIYKRELIEANGLRFPALRRFQDPPFMVRAMHEAKRFAFCPIESYAYRRQNKDIEWTPEKIHDYARGILDLLTYSRIQHLPKLHDRALFHIENDWYGPLENLLIKKRDQELAAILIEINETIDPDLIGRLRPDYRTGYTIKPLRALQKAKETV